MNIIEQLAKVVREQGPISYMRACDSVGIPKRDRTNYLAPLTEQVPQIYQVYDDVRDIVLDWNYDIGATNER